MLTYLNSLSDLLFMKEEAWNVSHTQLKKGSDKAIKGFLTMREENVKHHVGCKMKWQRHICDGLCTSAATIFSCIAKFDESAFLIWQMLFQ